jgi:aspartate-semialdehyde dehydrogenase
MKMVNETNKIFHDDSIRVTATCIRVPVLRAHCEDINIQFKNATSAEAVREIMRTCKSFCADLACAQLFTLGILCAAAGVKVVDDAAAGQFPEPIAASGQDDVLVGRIRNDISLPEGRGVNMFIAGDQLLKGAATNAVQIAELLL